MTLSAFARLFGIKKTEVSKTDLSKSQATNQSTELSNLLDLTDIKVQTHLRTGNEHFLRNRKTGNLISDRNHNYEMTHVLSDWASSKNYTGLIIPTQRGSISVVVFNPISFHQIN